MQALKETSVDKFTDFQSWLRKRVKANRHHFIKNMGDIRNWPAGKFLDYKGFLYVPVHIDWPEGRDYGTLYVRPVGQVRKLQSGPSTDIVPVSDKEIRIQVSHDIKKRKDKKPKLGKLSLKNPLKLKTSFG